MDKKIVLLGAGSAAFTPPTLIDIYQSKVLPGSTIVLLDINEEKLNRIYDIVVKENKIVGEKFNIEKTTDLKSAIKDADFVVCSIEHGDRFEHRWQDNTIPHKHGSTEMMAENGGPGGFFHSARQIPKIVEIAREVQKASPHAFFINYSNPMSRICLAIKRAVPNLKFMGLCHQIGLLLIDLPYIIDNQFQNKLKTISSLEKIKAHTESLKNTKITVGGLNHFAFIFGLKDLRTGKDLMPKFNSRCMEYYKNKQDRFKYSNLTFEIYDRLKWFPYVGDNHICEYLQIGHLYTQYQDLKDWIRRMEQGNKGVNKKFQRYHKKLKEGRYPKKGLLRKGETGEKCIDIIEGVIQDSNYYETAVNIPNNNIITNLPQDLVIECSATVNKEGLQGIKLGNIPKGIAAILRIEASIQDVCVEAILKESKDLAIDCLAMDVNCGSFEMAESIFKEMCDLQKQYLPNFR